MKRYEERVVERKVEGLAEVRCDICGAERHPQGDWGGGSFDVDEIRVRRTKGESYPEESYLSTMDVELCNNCWSDFIVWAKGRGGSNWQPYITTYYDRNHPEERAKLERP